MPTAVGAQAEKNPARLGFPVRRSVAMFMEVGRVGICPSDCTPHGEELVTSHDLAKRIDAPVKFFEQVLMELKKGGIVKSKRGNEGRLFIVQTAFTNNDWGCGQDH